MADKDKKKKKKKKTNTSNAGNATYSGSIALTKLKCVRMTKKNKKGKKIEGLFIPIKKNHFVEGKEGAVYMPLRVITRAEEDEYGQHGFISQSVDSKVWNAASEEEQAELKKLPILGNVKNFSSGGGGNDNSGVASEEIDEDDDLPF